jgi:hypothetical protein
VEERVVAALTMGHSLLVAQTHAGADEPVCQPDDLLRTAEEVFAVLARHHLNARLQYNRARAVS